MDETITISKRKYESLLTAQKKLHALEAMGVDNWEGYGEAMAEVYGNAEDEDGED